MNKRKKKNNQLMVVYMENKEFIDQNLIYRFGIKWHDAVNEFIIWRSSEEAKRK